MPQYTFITLKWPYSVLCRAVDIAITCVLLDYPIPFLLLEPFGFAEIRKQRCKSSSRSTHQLRPLLLLLLFLPSAGASCLPKMPPQSWSNRGGIFHCTPATSSHKFWNRLSPFLPSWEKSMVQVSPIANFQQKNMSFTKSFSGYFWKWTADGATEIITFKKKYENQPFTFWKAIYSTPFQKINRILLFCFKTSMNLWHNGLL